MKPATNLRAAYQAADPRPLPSGDPYFVDLTGAREARALDKLKQMIQNCDTNQFVACAFSGHRGSGKSTELRQLQEELKASCFTLYLDVHEFLDVEDVDYTDLFLLVSRQLLDKLQEHKIKLNSNLLTDVENWFRSVTKETEQTVELSAGVTTEAKMGIDIPFLARLLAKLTADAKAGSSRKVTTRQELDTYFKGLLNNTNTLLASASQALGQGGYPSQLLIIVDNLDRVPPEKSEKLFFSHGSQLQTLHCHAVYTVSLDTYYSQRGLDTVFPNHVILPNVKLRATKSDRGPSQKGIDLLIEIIRRRLDTNVLLDPPTLTQVFVELSGGSVRQLIRLLREAVLSAQSRGLTYIDHDATQDAAQALRQDFQRILSPSDYALLAKTSVTKRIEKTRDYMQLLSNMAVLEYNGRDVWQDVNPLIEPIDAFQAARKKLNVSTRSRKSGKTK